LGTVLNYPKVVLTGYLPDSVAICSLAVKMNRYHGLRAQRNGLSQLSCICRERLRLNIDEYWISPQQTYSVSRVNESE